MLLVACLVLQCIGLVCFSRGNWIFAAVCLAGVFQLLCVIEPQEMEKVKTKLGLFGRGFYFMVLAKDNKWKKLPDSDKIKDVEGKRVKRIIFIRHGESDWNDIFNRKGPMGKLMLLPLLFKNLAREIMMINEEHSIFLDSPLSPTGVTQALELQAFCESSSIDNIKSDEKQIEQVMTLRGEIFTGAETILVSSNLRRAMATASIGLQHRMGKLGEQMQIWSCCQEISRNIDTYALAPANGVPDLSDVQSKGGPKGPPVNKIDLAKCYDPKGNGGNKSLKSNGLKRMQDFCERAFDEEADNIVVGGHSLWFRSFFQTYMPASSGITLCERSKKKKMQNCAVVAFDLERGTSDEVGVAYRIDPKSMRCLFKDFEK
jgi:broad specificity phosphatase PhoE